MLPKKVYSKVLQSLRKIKERWEEDRQEDPRLVPYEIDLELRGCIEMHMREGHVNFGGRSNREAKIDETVSYLREKGLIFRGPYGGHFPVDVDEETIPTKEQLVADIKRRLGVK